MRSWALLTFECYIILGSVVRVPDLDKPNWKNMVKLKQGFVSLTPTLMHFFVLDY